MTVTSRQVAWLFPEQSRLAIVPVLHRLQGRFAVKGCLRQLLVAEPDIAVERGLQVLAGSEVVGLQDLLDPAVEPLDPLPGR